jgi:S1/P1 Nuclease
VRSILFSTVVGATGLRHMKKHNLLSLVLVSLTLLSTDALAWGRRGHQIVGENAALLVSAEKEAGFLRDHSFDFGYYANVPDFIWKRPATYGVERNEHYIDLEIFQREFAKHPEVTHPFALSRKEFETKFPEIKPEAGRAYWRIREMNEQLTALSKEPSGPARQKLQEKWLVLAGTLAHYIGDLGMPLHVSENHDGQLSEQKGVHSYFEEVIVDQLYPSLGTEVSRDVQKLWPAFKKKNADKSLEQLIEAVAERSLKTVPKLLALDKKSKREAIQKNSEMYRAMIRERLVDSTLALAEVYRRQIGWTFDNKKFYFFAGEPAYIAPSEGAVVPAAANAKAKQ